MTRDEERKRCIEAIKLALQDQTCIDLYGDYYWNHQATAAFDSLHGIARDISTELMEEIVTSMEVVLNKCGWTPYPSWRPLAKEALETARSAAGDLTNPPEKKP